MKKTTLLKQLLNAPEILIAPGAYDVLSAKIIAHMGFKAVYMTGYGTSASVLGQPDVGLLTMSEMVERARNIAEAVDVPVLADGDTGYGNPLNVIRTVREYEKAGVAAIQLEDQLFPKRCGHMLGRKVIPMEEMVQKIKAAVDTRIDDDFVIRKIKPESDDLKNAFAKIFAKGSKKIGFIISYRQLSVLTSVADELGKCLGKDFAVILLDYFPDFGSDQKYARIVCPMEELGTTGAKMLLRAIEENDIRKLEPKLFDPEFIKGDSCFFGE